LLSSLWDVYPEVELLDPFFNLEAAILFSIAVRTFYTATSRRQDLHFPHILTNTCYFLLSPQWRSQSQVQRPCSLQGYLVMSELLIRMLVSMTALHCKHPLMLTFPANELNCWVDLTL
jgi:uncharacterized membrane protein